MPPPKISSNDGFPDDTNTLNGDAGEERECGGIVSADGDEDEVDVSGFRLKEDIEYFVGSAKLFDCPSRALNLNLISSDDDNGQGPEKDRKRSSR